MGSAKQNQRQASLSSPAPRKTRASKSKSLSILYARLDKTRPGSPESKRIARQIVDAIG
jgi:hypothetical protein